MKGKNKNSFKRKDPKLILHSYRVFYDALSKHGAKLVIRTLTDLDIINYRRINGTGIADYIKEKVCDLYKVTKYDLHHSNKRGQINLARKTCMLLFTEYLDISDAKIAEHFGKHRNIIYKAKEEFEFMKKSKHPLDILFITKYNKLILLIESYIEGQERLNS